MKVLVISTDIKILENDSVVRKRMIDYSTMFDEFNIIVLGKSGNIENVGNMKIHPVCGGNKIVTFLKGINRALQYDVDIITTQDPFETGLIGMVVKLVNKVKLNIQVHTDFASKFFIKLHPLKYFIAKVTLKFADSIRVVSPRIKEYVGKDAFVLSIYTEASVGGGEYEKPFDVTLLTASRLEKEKDIKTIIKALKYLGDNYGLVVVGDGGYMKRLKKLTDRLNLSDRVIFEGYQTDVNKYYNSCDIYVSASLFEGYGLSILQAYLSNMKIVTTDVGIVGYGVKDVEIFKQGDYRGLANAIKNVGEVGDREFDNISYEEYLQKFKESLLI